MIFGAFTVVLSSMGGGTQIHCSDLALSLGQQGCHAQKKKNKNHGFMDGQLQGPCSHIDRGLVQRPLGIVAPAFVALSGVCAKTVVEPENSVVSLQPFCATVMKGVGYNADVDK